MPDGQHKPNARLAALNSASDRWPAERHAINLSSFSNMSCAPKASGRGRAGAAAAAVDGAGVVVLPEAAGEGVAIAGGAETPAAMASTLVK